MKCLVCGKDYEAAECPRCHCPDVLIVGDREKALEKILPTINQYRINFARTVKLSLITYRWKDLNGHLALDQKELISLGTAEELMQSEKWLDNKFARIADSEKITVDVCIATDDSEQTVTVVVPNLKKAELQQLGARVDDSFGLSLLLRNDTEAPTISEPVALFV